MPLESTLNTWFWFAFTQFSLQSYFYGYAWVDETLLCLCDQRWYPNSRRKIFSGKAATNVQMTYVSTQHNTEMAFSVWFFFPSITQLTIDFLTAKTLKWQNRFFKTFSVIKNGCLDAEGEFLKGNVAFHFLSSTTQLKEKCVEIKSLEFHLVHHPLSKIYLKNLDFTDNF